MNKRIINEEEYKHLLDEIYFLECLRNAGVDSWDGYDYAIAMYQGGDGK